MEYDLNNTLEQTRQLNLTGNIIPHTWYTKITFKNGTPDLLGIVLLADILYWYRLVEIKDEKTGKLMGYKKKFKADMLQRSLGDFSKQFGYNKRQISEALKRLEDAGLIIKKLRTIETAMGVINNVLFVAPVPSTIAMLDKNVNQDYSTELSTLDDAFVSDDESAAFISVNVPPTAFERSRGYVQTYHPLRSNVVGTPVKRSTYTENTTKITTKITTAAQPTIAAAVFSKKIENNSADALIADVLTQSQVKIIEHTACELAKLSTVDSTTLTKEIEFVILSKTAFTNANRDFFKKLNTIKKVIKEGRWNSPASMLEKKAVEHKKAVDPIKQELNEAELDCVHWQKMMHLSLEKGQESDANNFKKLLQQTQEKIQSIKLKFFDVTNNNIACNGIKIL